MIFSTHWLTFWYHQILHFQVPTLLSPQTALFYHNRCFCLAGCVYLAPQLALPLAPSPWQNAAFVAHHTAFRAPPPLGRIKSPKRFAPAHSAPQPNFHALNLNPLLILPVRCDFVLCEFCRLLKPVCFCFEPMHALFPCNKTKHFEAILVSQLGESD